MYIITICMVIPVTWADLMLTAGLLEDIFNKILVCIYTIILSQMTHLRSFVQQQIMIPEKYLDNEKNKKWWSGFGLGPSEMLSRQQRIKLNKYKYPSIELSI